MKIRFPLMQFPELTDYQMAVMMTLIVVLALLPVLGAIRAKWLSHDEK